MTARFDGPLEGALTLVRAALPSVPVVNQLPGIRKTGGQMSGLSRTGKATTIERGHVDAFAKVCGFPVKDTVPLPYPHLLAFPFQMAIMSDPGFPAPAIGTVHLENSITAHRPLAIGESVNVTVNVVAGRPHPKGTVYDFTTLVRTDGETVWEETSTYLRRGKGDPEASSGRAFPDAEPHGIVWRLPGDLGRRYAAVSGDHNPIHLYPITARAMGFPRQIAHGMWTMSRCVAALENRLPGAVRVDVAFKRPVLLPGSVAFGSAPVEGDFAFSLSDPKSGAPHLAGRTTAL
jgi:acyl dehydratase